MTRARPLGSVTISRPAPPSCCARVFTFHLPPDGREATCTTVPKPSSGSSTQVEDILGGMLAWLLDIRRVLVIGFAGPERLMASGAFKRRLADLDREIATEIASRRADPELEHRPDILSLLIRARNEAGEC
jgi:hypothetical protein